MIMCGCRPMDVPDSLKLAGTTFAIEDCFGLFIINRLHSGNCSWYRMICFEYAKYGRYICMHTFQDVQP